MFQKAYDITIKGLGGTISNILVVNPSVEKHLENYIATGVKDDQKEIASKLLKALKQDAKSNSTRNVNFSASFTIEATLLVARSFKIHPLMIVLLLVAFIFSLLQIPNLGLRIGNLLRNKFGVSRKAQAAIAEVFNFVSKIAKDVTGMFSQVLHIMAPLTPLLSIQPFMDSITVLSKDPRTKVAFNRALEKLDVKEKNYIKSKLGKNSNPSDLQFSRMPFNPRLHTQLSLEQGTSGDFDFLFTSVRVITQMLSFPGVGQVVMIIISQFIPISMLSVMIGGSLVTAGGSIATKLLDSLQRLRDQMSAYNSII